MNEEQTAAVSLWHSAALDLRQFCCIIRPFKYDHHCFKREHTECEEDTAYQS